MDTEEFDQRLRASLRAYAAEAEAARLRDQLAQLSEAALNVLELAHEGAIQPTNDELLHRVTLRFDRLERATSFPNRINYQD